MHLIKFNTIGNSLVVQWLGLHASIAGGMGLIPGWETKILHAAVRPKKKKINTMVTPSKLGKEGNFLNLMKGIY